MWWAAACDDGAPTLWHCAAAAAAAAPAALELHGGFSGTHEVCLPHYLKKMYLHWVLCTVRVETSSFI